MNPPNAGKRWTAEQDEELRERIARNQPQSKIAHALGRTFTAISSRAQLLGLRTPAPLRPRRKG
jgi:hypothetical protein